MIVELQIQNFAIIDSLSISLDPALNVFSGETGAGKSIILDALSLLGGSKCEAWNFRDPEKPLLVRALCQIRPNESLMELFENLGLEWTEEVLIQREVSLPNKNRSLINGKVVRQSDLKALAPLLWNIHSQHETQLLLDARAHPALFHALGQNDFQLDLQACRQKFQALADLCHKEELSESRMREIVRLKAILESELEQIAKIAPAMDEEARLNEMHQALVNQAEIESTLQTVLAELDPSEERSLSRKWRESLRLLRLLKELNSRAGSVFERAEALDFLLEEIKMGLHDFASSLEQAEGKSLHEIEDRIAQIELLKRRFGPDIPSILAYEKKAADQLFSLMAEEKASSSYTQEIQILVQEMLPLQKALHQKKIHLKNQLEKELNQSLQFLGMQGARFEVRFIEAKGPILREGLIFGPDGDKSVEFYLQGNPGQPFHPLQKIASGGEISRLMLALKKVLASVHPVDTFLFDEIDAGIGGETAHNVAKTLSEISHLRQSIVITHLAQVALPAQAHFLVEKTTDKSHTSSSIRALNKEERVQEIQRMMGISGQKDGALVARKLLEEK